MRSNLPSWGSLLEFWISLKVEVTQSFSDLMSDHPQRKTVFLLFKWIYLVATSLWCLLFCHWAPTRRVRLHLLCNYPPDSLGQQQDLSFFWLNKPSSLSLSLYIICSSALMAFLWTHSSIFMYFLYWGVQSWTQYFRCSLTSSKQREIITSLHLLSMPLLLV